MPTSTLLPFAPTTRPAGLRLSRVTHNGLVPLLAVCAEHAGHAGGDGRPARPDPVQAGTLELQEILFDPPVRAWAWLAWTDHDRVAGYALATAGFSMPGHGYSLRLEALFARPGLARDEIEWQLFEQARNHAQRMGCLDLQWQLPATQIGRLAARLPPQALSPRLVHGSISLAGTQPLRERHHG